MSANGLNVFEKTPQTAHVWLDDLAEVQALWPDAASSGNGEELYVAGAGQEAADAASVPAS